MKEAISVATADKNSLEQSLLEQETAFKEMQLRLESETDLKKEELQSINSAKVEPLEREIKAVRKNNESKKQTIADLEKSVADVKVEKLTITQKVLELENKLQAKWEELETELHLKIEALNREITTVKHENKAKEVEIETLKDNIASEITEKNILKEKVVELEADIRKVLTQGSLKGVAEEL